MYIFFSIVEWDNNCFRLLLLYQCVNDDVRGGGVEECGGDVEGVGGEEGGEFSGDGDDELMRGGWC